MAVTVKTGGTFTKDPGQRPGLYVRFVERALAAISVGSRSKVAMLKSIPTTAGGTAVADKVYRVTNMEQADGLFGAANTEEFSLLIIGGASEIVVSTFADTAIDFNIPLNRLETYEFHIYVNPPGSASGLDTAAYTWLKACRTNGKNFVAVFTDESKEGLITDLKTAAITFADEYAVFVGGGVKNADGTLVTADKYACYVAGVVAGMSLDGSLTYYNVPFAETITRYRSTEVKDLLASGILVTVMDGDQPRIEQGLTLGTAPFNKIRTVRAKQAMIDDINRAVNDSYVGKITNNDNGQIAVINAIKVYLETLANANVVARDYVVELDKTQVSEGADLYVNVAVRFLDSIEYVYLTITV